VSGRFGFNTRSHHGAHPPCRHDPPAKVSYSHFEPSHFDGPHFPHRGSHPTRSNCEVHKIVVTSSVHMVKC
jgi:hypothetical protein